METAGKQLTSLPRHFDELKVAVGTEFQAEFSKGIEIVTTMLKNLKTVATSLRPVRSAIEKQTEALKEGDIVWEAYLGSLEAARMGMTQTQRQQFKMIENTEGHEQALMWLAEQLGITDLHVLKLEAGYRELGLTFEEINPEVRNFVPAIEEVGDEAEDTAFDLEALDDRLGNFLGTIETDAEKALGDMAGKLDWELLTGGSADAAMQDVQRMIQYYGELGDNQGLEQTRQDAENLAAAVLNVKVQSGEMYPSEAAVQMRDDFGLAYDDALELVTEAENLEDALTRLDEQRTLINIHWTMTGQVPDAAIELLGGGGA
nr:hypothetical protein [candidate division Zixibacteria bacterium]NIS48978.1 hypothetical protein [candidate division Zixibacteria bacterium]NIU17061.1 hypothetical protein [candidate division Zixibacteria bacterium]NIW97062.1 hypothetical protein [Phycisphaerae bacterium]